MKKIKDKSKLFMIIGITIFVIALLGSAYAYYRFVLLNINVNTITRGLDYYIVYNKGTDITSAVLNPSDDYTGGNSIDVTLYKKDNTYDIYGHIYLDITQIGDNLKKSRALRYTVLDGDTIISEGGLKNATGSVCLASNIVLGTVPKNYTIYLWFYDLNSTGNESNDIIKANIRCEASNVLIPEMKNYTLERISDHINYLYNKSEKTEVTNNEVTPIKYNYATDVGLMNDRLGSMSTLIDSGNIRYYGANPNNYIYFNCDDYSNQTDTTCEKWRIIGVFDGKVKIMRNESIGSYSWDNKGTSSGAESAYGKNNWSDARLMKMLNAGYESETGGSLYWKRQNGTCYSGTTADTTKSCDMSSIGLKNEITRNMISETTYSLLGCGDSSIYSDQVYNYERTTGSVYNETTRDKSWTGKVALAYPSDYGYAVDLSQCSQTLFDYDNSTCKSNDWMLNSASQWLLTPYSGNSNGVWGVDGSGYLTGNNAFNENGVRPVLYLGSELEIKAGDGKSDSPYQLSA